MVSVNQKLELKDIADAIALAQVLDRVPNITMIDTIGRVYPNLNVSPIVLKSYAGKNKSELVDLLLLKVQEL